MWYPLKLKKFFKVLGPGLITGASDDDPSGIGTYSQAGAKFGPELLWTLVLTYPLMFCVQNICGRIGRTSGRGLAANLKKHYSRSILLKSQPWDILPLVFWEVRRFFISLD